MKRKRESSDYENKPYKKVRATAKKPYIQTDSRAGYSTVARTRGVYAQGEMKYFDSELIASSVTSAASWLSTNLDPALVPVAGINTLFAPTVGAGISQRIGKSCDVYKIKIRGLVGVSQTGDDTTANRGCMVRLALVEDMQTNGSQLSGNLVFTTPTSTEAETAICSFQNINNFGRFRVMKDKLFLLQDTNMVGAENDFTRNGLVKPFKWTIKFRQPRKVRFNAVNGGTIADIVDNSWHIIGLASTDAYAPYLTYQCRVCYKE